MKKDIKYDESTKNRILSIVPLLNERQKRLYLGAEAISYGWGGVSFVSNVSGVERNTIASGKKELLGGGPDSSVLDDGQGVATKNIEGTTWNGRQRIRKAGAGRPSIERTQPGVTEAILSMVDKASYGNPENPLVWVAKSTRTIANELAEKGFKISHRQVGKILSDNGFTLQTNRKLKQVGKQHPDRNKQFEHINETVVMYSNAGQTVISVDCKKKENLGQFKNNGVEYCEKGHPVAVLDHDFMIKENGKAVPYGIYDIANNEGFVNVGMSSDTAEFAVASIKDWYIRKLPLSRN